MSETREKYQALIVKYLAKETSLSEEETLFQWLKEDPEHQLLFDQTEGVWNKAGKSDTESFTPDVDMAWNKLKHRIGQGQSDPVEKTKVINLFSRAGFRVAASIALLIATSAIAFFYLKSDESQWVQLAATNSRTKVVLPDSSEVWLTQGSQLSYIQGFDGKTREVKLEGEAFFEVQSDESKPFVVVGHATKVQVLGTSFMVHSAKGDSVEFVQVATGKVQFAERGHEENTVTLLPGDEAIFVPEKPIRLREKRAQNTDVLKTNHLSFDNTALKEVLSDMQRYFGTAIQVENENLLNCRFTGDFQDPTEEGVLIVLSLSVNATYQKEGGGYVLRGNGCQ